MSDLVSIKNGDEFVLATCPHLTSLDISLLYKSVITTLVLDLPSLERLNLWDCSGLETLKLTCPNLVNVKNVLCTRLAFPPTLFSQLTDFGGYVSHILVLRDMPSAITNYISMQKRDWKAYICIQPVGVCV